MSFHLSSRRVESKAPGPWPHAKPSSHRKRTEAAMIWGVGTKEARVKTWDRAWPTSAGLL